MCCEVKLLDEQHLDLPLLYESLLLEYIASAITAYLEQLT